MNKTLTIQINNKQGVWLSIVGFFKAMGCQPEIKNVVEHGEQRTIILNIGSQQSITEDDINRLENFSEDVLSVKEGEHKVTKTPEKVAETKVDSNESVSRQVKKQKPEAPVLMSNEEESVPQAASSLKLIVISVILLIAVGSYFGLQQDIDQDQVATVNETKIQPELTTVLAKSTDGLPQTSSLSSEQKQQQKTDADTKELQVKISSLLVEAEQLISGSDLSETSVAHALQQYQHVLELDPENTDAKLGIEAVAKAYVVLSDQALATSNFDQAQKYLQLAEVTLPQNSFVEPAQQRLREQQSTELAENQKQDEIASLLSQAGIAYQAKRFSKPVNDNAIAHYRAVLDLDANNAGAEQGLMNVANSYILMAKEAIKLQNLDRAETYISQASALKPGAEKLSTLQQQFDKAKLDQNNKTVVEKQVEKLLTKAIANKKASRLHSPEGNNALADYRAVLVLQPDNKVALAGLESMVSRDIKLAQAAIENQELTVAEKHIQQAESVLPNAIEVQSLRQRLQQANKTAVAEQKASAKPDQSIANKQISSAEVDKKQSGQIAIIVHPSNQLTELSSSQLKKIFTGQQSNWDEGGKIVVLNQAVESSARARFYKAVLNASPDTVFKQYYYGSTGQIPFIAKERASDSSVKKYIRRNKKSIGYIYLSNVDHSVKTLKINGAEPSSKDYLLR